MKEVEDRVANATNANLDVDWPGMHDPHLHPPLGAKNANPKV